MKTETLGVLKQAREILVTEGWGKGMFYNGNTGCYCLEGAIMAAAGTNDGGEWSQEGMDADQQACLALKRTLQRRNQGWSIPRFNDAQASVEPVLDVLDETIALLEEGTDV